MDLSTYHQINGLLDPSLILIEKLTRVMLIAGSVFASQHGCPAVHDEVMLLTLVSPDRKRLLSSTPPTSWLKSFAPMLWWRVPVSFREPLNPRNIPRRGPERAPSLPLP